MITLNYKVLLIRTSFLVFVRALGIYLLVTLPTLVFPPMYVMSAGFALSFGWLAGLLFTVFFYLLQKTAITVSQKQLLLYVAIAVSVLFAFQLMDVLHAWDNVWASGPFLLFPLVAIVSGCISARVSRHKINELLVPATVSGFENNRTDSPLTPNSNI